MEPRAGAPGGGFGPVGLREEDVDRAAARLVEERVLRKHRALPLRVEQDRLVVAMSDPADLHALEDLTMLSGHRVLPVPASETVIGRLRERIFAAGAPVAENGAGDRGGVPGDVEIGEEGGVGEAPVVRLAGSILRRAVDEGASDVHVEPRAGETVVRLRVDGVLREVVRVPPGRGAAVVARLKVLANLDIAEKRVPQDGRFSAAVGGKKVDLRAATLPTVFGEKVVLRLLDAANVEVDLGGLGMTVGMLALYERVFRRASGTILVTGPTGSGKSTTLYATLRELNSPEKNVITIEDPVEYRMRGVNQVQVNPKAGLTFASGLRSILRGDPDVLMVGEVRDRETAKISVEAALTGHLVLATLHTNDAPAAVARLTDMGVEPFLTASAVDCVVAQRLARRLCEACKRPAEPDEHALSALGFPSEGHPEGLPAKLCFHEAVGCGECGGTGYRGRIGVYEVMVVGEALRGLIVRRAPADELRRAAVASGMVGLKEDGLGKAALGVTTVEEVLRTVV